MVTVVAVTSPLICYTDIGDLSLGLKLSPCSECCILSFG
jgi:hypothetical protein